MRESGLRQSALRLGVAMAVLLAAGSASAQTAVGAILAEQGRVRPFPSAATTFRFTRLAGDNDDIGDAVKGT